MKLLILTCVGAIPLALLLTRILLPVAGRCGMFRPASVALGRTQPLTNLLRLELYLGGISLAMASFMTFVLGGAYWGLSACYRRLVLRSDWVLTVPVWFWFILAAFLALPLAALIGHRWLFSNLLGHAAYAQYRQQSDARYKVNGQRLLAALTLLILALNLILGCLALGSYTKLTDSQFCSNAFWTWKTHQYGWRQVVEIRRIRWVTQKVELHRPITFEVVFNDGWIWRSDQGLLAPDLRQTTAFIEQLSNRSFQRIRDVRAFATPPKLTQPVTVPAPTPIKPSSRPQTR